MKTHHKAALGVAAGRTLLGIYALADPGRPARSWLGSHADDTVAAVFGRTLGARDLALGAGAVWALAGRPGDRPVVAAWVAAGAAADAADAAATLAAWGRLPSPWKQVTVAAALGSMVTGGVVAGLVAKG
jgi:hypothetical protein